MVLDLLYHVLSRKTNPLWTMEMERKEKEMTKPERHMALCQELNAIYTKKNHDYGDSYHVTYLEEGMAMPRIRMSDKLNRFKSLTRKPGEALVNDESIRDTLMDLANYALMTVLELDSEAEVNEHEE